MSFLRFLGAEVLGMANTLERSGGHMKGAARDMARTDADHIGTEDLHAACEEFSHSWDYGLGQLSKMTKGISKFAVKTSDELSALDEKLYRELTDHQKSA
ncbi:hypothetical protein [Streptomyces sp. NPDC007088]|uniref:hypothetical protein n=1 Tax=Streptomyces sp. NPDC007088 TaxID=3364773 RepID=UPI00367492F7